MLIKSVTKGGSAVPFSPEEALVPALAIALAQQNNSEFVYWTQDKKVATEAFQPTFKENGDYDAIAHGICSVGKTRIKDDRFFVAKPHSFQIHYKSSKDEIGAPHVQVVSFAITLIETNPANMVGDVDRTNNSPVPVIGEMYANPPIRTSQGGKINSKKR